MPQRQVNYEPIRVTAHLRTSVVSDEYLPLDGIVLYQRMREEHGERNVSLPGGGVDTTTIPPVQMPFKLCFENTDRTGAWWYACSFAYPQPFGSAQGWWLAEAQDHWNKRFDQSYVDLIDFAGKSGRVIIEKGRYRAYHMPVFYRAALQIEWYAVADLAWMKEILGTVTHIGKKSVQGWGRVASWDVEPCAEDWSCWRDGRPTRALPASLVAQQNRMANLRNYGLRPAYYDRKNQMLVAVP